MSIANSACHCSLIEKISEEGLIEEDKPDDFYNEEIKAFKDMGFSTSWWAHKETFRVPGDKKTTENVSAANET